MPRIVRLILYILRVFFLIDDIIERDAQPRGPLIQMWRVQVWRKADGDKSFRLFFSPNVFWVVWEETALCYQTTSASRNGDRRLMRP